MKNTLTDSSSSRKQILNDITASFRGCLVLLLSKGNILGIWTVMLGEHLIQHRKEQLRIFCCSWSSQFARVCLVAVCWGGLLSWCLKLNAKQSCKLTQLCWGRPGTRPEQCNPSLIPSFAISFICLLSPSVTEENETEKKNAIYWVCDHGSSIIMLFWQARVTWTGRTGRFCNLWK